MEDGKRITTAERRYYAGTNDRLGKYGYIIVRPMTEEQDAVVRKITPLQRRCIILYYVKTHKGKPISISFLAKKLGCEDRTIQYDLKYLYKHGHVVQFRNFDEKTKAQLANIYVFREAIDNPFFLLNPTLRKVYGKANYLGLREWHWDDYKTIPGVCDEYHNAFDKYENLVELNEKKAKQRKLREKAEYDHVATYPALEKRINRFVVKKN